ncbi:MAG: translation elongation factor-like protein [Candidatus Neomarinimicrobiota bacterium]
MSEKKIGMISHYFGNISVAGIEIEKGKLEVGDTIRIKGHTTDFTQTINSMQIDLQTVEKAKKGDSIGIKVSKRVREHDEVYLVT